MIKEAMEYLVSLKKPVIEEIGDCMYSDKQLHLIPRPVVTRQKATHVNNLSGIVDYLNSGKDLSLGSPFPKKVFVHVLSPWVVNVFSPLNEEMERDHYMVAEARIPEFKFDRYYDTEDFNIKLQSCFVHTEDRDLMLKIVGNLKEEAVRTVGDDGISQSVTAKTGVATVGNVKVPNPVLLKPYITFQEIEQPEINYVFRMRTGPECALFEADGGAWKNAAIDRIASYFKAELGLLIETGTVSVIS